MAFLRFNRDKRGYEHFYLVEPITNRRGRVRARVLYWFRTPPDVKVGREPFDLAARQALEAQNPQFAFDWRKIVETPIPSADADRWRERRRAERAARHAAPSKQLGGAENGSEAEQAERQDTQGPDTDAAETDASETDAAETEAADAEIPEAAGLTAAELTQTAELSEAAPSPSDANRRHKRRRRRRRGRRGRPPGNAQAPQAAGSPGSPDPDGPRGVERETGRPVEPSGSDV